MEYRHLGKSGLKVSALSLGGWVTYGGQVGEDIAAECMNEAYKVGFSPSLSLSFTLSLSLSLFYALLFPNMHDRSCRSHVLYLPLSLIPIQ
jgi:hypothetical protein